MISFRGLVDVCGGKMTLRELTEEIFHYMLVKDPARMIIDIQKRPNGIHATIWMSVKDFKKRSRGSEIARLKDEMVDIKRRWHD